MGFTDQQLERYSRHIILKEIGVKGQKKLQSGKVLIVGAGGLGAPAALYLAAAGVGTIGIADADSVDLSNLQRQIIHATADIGKPKVDSARESMEAINPEVRVVPYHTFLSSANILELIRDYDFILDGTDNFPAKFLINDACVLAGKAFCHAGIIRFKGQLMTYVPGQGPCYRWWKRRCWKLRRFKLLPLLLAALLPALSACAPSAPPAPGSAVSLSAQAETALTVTDDLGREVEVPLRPRRVAALIGSFADIWTLAGGGESLVAAAEDSWTSFDLDLGEEVVHLGSAKDPSLEAILSAQPELILASTDTGADLELLPTFEELGCPALYFRVETFSDYLRMLELCTRLTGQPENYQRYGLQVQEQVEAALGRQEGSGPSVLYIRASSTVSRAKGSQGNVLGEMLRALGCRNIADGREELLEELSLEAILAEDPAYIFIVYQAADPAKAQALLEETLLSEPAWASLRAVREGRCFVLDQRLYNLKPNARWGEAYEQLAELLYGG